MATSSVRKFVISVDPDEALDFAEELSYFEETFLQSGLTKAGTYTFRYTDQETLIKIDLSESSDGYYVYAYVQAPGEHVYRLEEIADLLGGYIIVANAQYN